MSEGGRREKRRENPLHESVTKIYDQTFCGGGGLVAKSGLKLMTPWTLLTRLLCPSGFPGKITVVHEDKLS